MRVTHINAAFWLLWLMLVAFSYFNSADDPSSLFYDPNRAFEQRFSAVRAAEADELIARANTTAAAAAGPSGPRPPPTTVAPGPAANETFLCIGIPSINRTTQSFLAHTVATLVDTLETRDRATVHLVVLLADRDPASHSAYGQPWLASLADEVLVYGGGGGGGDDNNEQTGGEGGVYRTVSPDVHNGRPRGDGRVENMRLDHSVLVETCRARGSPYFALVEDDIVAGRDWFARLRAGLARVDAPGSRDWLYLRLFYSELFMGWNAEEWVVYSETIFLVYALVLLAFLEMRRRRLKPGTGTGGGGGGSSAARTASNYLAALVFGLWMPALIVLFFLAGRVSVGRLLPWPSTGVREMPQYGCCAQGLVFPRRHLAPFQALLRDPPYDFPGDMKLEGYAERNGLAKWALEPSVFQHVGLKESSAGPRRADVWNFSFERIRGRR